MLRTRVIPALLIFNGSLVKTYQFKKYRYIGDPVNTVRIFNELEVDELILLDISNDRHLSGPNYLLLKDLASECFMPVTYGGGLYDIESVKRIFDIGFEKVVLNSALKNNLNLIEDLSKLYGSQAIVASIDFKSNFFGNKFVYTNSGKTKLNMNPIQWAKILEDKGAGELLLTSIDLEGTYKGYDLDILEKISQTVNIPVIINGGAGDLIHIKRAIDFGASAVALGSKVVFQNKDMGVLINFPNNEILKKYINN